MPDGLEEALEQRVEELGFELVELERAGSRTRPVLRLRVDRPDSEPGHGITIDECARVSRALEPLVEERLGGGAPYVLEVSSPGIERRLTRPRDFRRFAGREVSVQGYGPLAGRARRLEGELLGLARSGDEERIRIRLDDGEEVEVPRSDVARVQLVFRWNDDR